MMYKSPSIATPLRTLFRNAIAGSRRLQNNRLLWRVLGVASVVCFVGLSVAAVKGATREERTPMVRFVDDLPPSQNRPLVLQAVTERTADSATQSDLAAKTVELIHSVAPASPAKVDGKVSVHKVYWMEVTAYCPCTKCCGPNAQGITASGKDISYNRGRFVAADTSVLPFGTRLIIPGYHHDLPVEVIDRGGAIKGQKLDVFFPTHDEALEWGRRFVAVSVAE